MLVLSRRVNERILIDGDIRITILSQRGNQVRLGIEAPPNVKIIREELADRPLSPDGPESTKPGAFRAADPIGMPVCSMAPLASAVNRYHVLSTLC